MERDSVCLRAEWIFLRRAPPGRHLGEPQKLNFKNANIQLEWFNLNDSSSQNNCILIRPPNPTAPIQLLDWLPDQAPLLLALIIFEKFECSNLHFRRTDDGECISCVYNIHCISCVYRKQQQLESQFVSTSLPLVPTCNTIHSLTHEMFFLSNGFSPKSCKLEREGFSNNKQQNFHGKICIWNGKKLAIQKEKKANPVPHKKCKFMWINSLGWRKGRQKINAS